MTDTILVTDADFPDLEPERRLADEVGADALLVQYAPITRAVFEALDLAVVGRYGIGVDAVDLEAATDHGVPVVNVPDYCQDEVAEHTLALCLSCVRETARFDADVKRGAWDWTAGRPIHRLQGATVGFVGFGSIPERFVAKAAGFDFEYLAYDPYRSQAALAAAGVEGVGLRELLERSRVVSVHAPLTDETRGLLGREAFATMREDAVLINTARGELVDTAALSAALAAGEIAGAGIDVMAEEPPDESPLFDREEVVLTPHVAWYSEESIAALRETVTRDALAVLAGDEPTNPVQS
ncbi:MAG: C-terminal binding protein [Halalkalicoccus sp.]